jgi:hypothetical protein
MESSAVKVNKSASFQVVAIISDAASSGDINENMKKVI